MSTSLTSRRARLSRFISPSFTQGALASLQGLTAIVSPLAAGWLFGAFTGPAAPVYFPGAPFLMSVLTYVAAFAAIRGLPRDLAWVQPRRA